MTSKNEFRLIFALPPHHSNTQILDRDDHGNNGVSFCTAKAQQLQHDQEQSSRNTALQNDEHEKEQQIFSKSSTTSTTTSNLLYDVLVRLCRRFLSSHDQPIVADTNYSSLFSKIHTIETFPNASAALDATETQGDPYIITTVSAGKQQQGRCIFGNPGGCGISFSITAREPNRETCSRISLASIYIICIYVNFQ